MQVGDYVQINNLVRATDQCSPKYQFPFLNVQLTVQLPDIFSNSNNDMKTSPSCFHDK